MSQHLALVSDPLMQFAAAFAALVHEVDHRGVTNMQRVNNNDALAVRHNGKFVAEQHSVGCVWAALMEDRYTELHRRIYQTDEDMIRFGQFSNQRRNCNGYC